MKLSCPWITLTTVLAGLSIAHAQPPPSSQTPFMVGISTHLMNIDRPLNAPLNLVAEAGFNAVKDDVFWSMVAPTAHELRIFPQWRRYLVQAQNLQLSRLAILGYSTRFHDNAKPRTPVVTDAFLTYVDYVSRQLGNRVNIYEIWNEWDSEAPRDRQLAMDYAALISKTAPLLRRNLDKAPGSRALILAGAITTEGMKHGFVEPLIDSGALDLVDGLSIHPYVHCEANGANTPEAWARWVRGYEQQVRSRAGRDVPIYLTEVGWPSHQGACGVSETTQALYMARIWFLARTIPNIKGMWWYDLLNDGSNRRDQEHNFGLLHEDLSPKPAWVMMKAIAPVVRDFSYDAQASVLTDELYQLYFNRGQERVLVAWTVGKPQQQQVTSQAPVSGPVRLIDTRNLSGLVDNGLTWQCSDGQCSTSITLTEFPQIIRLTP